MRIFGSGYYSRWRRKGLRSREECVVVVAGGADHGGEAKEELFVGGAEKVGREGGPLVINKYLWLLAV